MLAHEIIARFHVSFDIIIVIFRYNFSDIVNKHYKILIILDIMGNINLLTYY